MPPSKDYVGLVSEYVHTVSHNDAEEANVRAMALKTWNSLKRSAKAGPRKPVRKSHNVRAKYKFAVRDMACHTTHSIMIMHYMMLSENAEAPLTAA